MGWLLAEAHEKSNAKHGPKIARRDYLKKKLTGDISVRAGKVVQILAAQPHERKAIGNALKKVRREIVNLTKS